MNNAFELRCPNCGGTTCLDIAATVWVRLTEDGTDADASENGDHEWDDESACTCAACGWTGTVLNADPNPDAPEIAARAAPSKEHQLTEALHNIIRSSNANDGDSLAEAVLAAIELVGQPEDDETVYTTREDAVRAIEGWLGDGGSYALASRVYDYMREQGIVTHNGTGLVIERDANVFQYAADLAEQDKECEAGLHSWTGESGKLPPDTVCTRCGARYGNPD